MIKVFAILDKKGNYYMSSLLRIKEGNKKSRNDLVKAYKNIVPIKSKDIRFITYVEVEDEEIDSAKEIMSRVHNRFNPNVKGCIYGNYEELVKEENYLEKIRRKFKNKEFDFTK